ncbi:unnamed protein product [Knipowitschia caucasica]|uniref:Barttin n=1 Tax=Knipowitschia caucasica TaxID=637954 RepID=A0AAV2KSD7_KNICA
MVQGKPYRVGLMVAGLAVIAVGLFILVEEKPHVYGTMCALGVIMLCAGTIWSLCQCYPKVMLVSHSQEMEAVCISERDKRLADPVPEVFGQKCKSSGPLSGPMSGPMSGPLSHSCPSLQLV